MQHSRSRIQFSPHHLDGPTEVVIKSLSAREEDDGSEGLDGGSEATGSDENRIKAEQNREKETGGRDRGGCEPSQQDTL